ncbi:MAG: hypothetical protein ACJA2Q_002263 [Pseudohongiellaceae bacterium]|jgi:hypothetical protein
MFDEASESYILMLATHWIARILHINSIEQMDVTQWR